MQLASRGGRLSAVRPLARAAGALAAAVGLSCLPAGGSAQQVLAPALPAPVIGGAPIAPLYSAARALSDLRLGTLPTVSAMPLQAPAPAIIAAMPDVRTKPVELALARDAGDALDRLLVKDGASEEFYAKVRRLAASLPPEALRAALALGYTVRVTGYVTEGRPDLDSSYDRGSGLHDWGERGNFVIVAEHVLVDVRGPDGRPRPLGEWQESVFWENALVHEMGHVLDAAFRLSSDPAFIGAWEEDYAAMPGQVKTRQLPDGKPNKFYYFLRPGSDGSFKGSRAETCAEAFDVLLRRERSDYNFGNFTAYLPRTLAALRDLLQQRAGIALAPRVLR